MANAIYPMGRQGFAGGDIAWDSDTIKCMLVKSTYTYVSTHAYVSDLGAVDNGRSTGFTSKTYTDGICDAADITITATEAAACNALVIFKNNTYDTAARLIAYIDTALGLPITPATSATVSIAWASTVNKIFKL